MKLLKIANFFLLALLLSACQVELNNVEDDDEVVEYIFYKSEMVDDIYPTSNEYDLTITGARNKLEIEGDIRHLTITNDDNQLELLDRDYVEEISLSASGVIINAVDTDVKKIMIAGDGNVITVADCNSLLIAGNDNQVISMKEGGCDEEGGIDRKPIKNCTVICKKGTTLKF